MNILSVLFGAVLFLINAGMYIVSIVLIGCWWAAWFDYGNRQVALGRATLLLIISAVFFHKNVIKQRHVRSLFYF